MKILITGIIGFIGFHTALKLLIEGNEIIGIDNINDYYDINLKKENLRILNFYDNFTFIKEDIIDSNCIDNFKPDKVIHLAAMAGVRYSFKNPKLYCRVNIEGTVNLLEQSKNNNVKMFVYASSSSVYGNNDNKFKESEDLNEPESIYAATKRSVEMMAKLYNKTYGLNVIGLRFFTVFGPRGRPDMAPRKFLEKVIREEHIDKYGDGSSYRDYTYIDDIVNGICLSVDSKYTNEIFNLGNDRTYTLNKFIEYIGEVTNKNVNINQMGKQVGDVNGTNANIEKSIDMLGYNPKISFRDGLLNTYKYLLDWDKLSKIRIIQTGDKRTGSTLLVNMVYGFLNRKERVSIGSARDNLIVKMHTLDLNKWEQKYNNYNLFWVISEREKKKRLDSKYRNLNNVLIIDYDELNETDSNSLENICNNIVNKFIDFFPDILLPGVGKEVLYDNVLDRIRNMNKRYDEIRKLNFSYIDDFYQIHGSHKTKDQK
jgi:UDP-glucuronate 4-epimerase